MVEAFTEQVRSRPAAQQGVQINPTAAAFGSAVGAGLQSVGVGLDQAAQLFQARDTLRAETDARAALNDLMDRDRALRLDPQTGFLTQTGANALGARESYAEAWRRAREEISRGLSPQARREFDPRADSLRQSSFEQFIRHEGNELRSYTVEQGNATVQSFVDEALIAHDNPTLFSQHLSTAVQEYNRIAALQGLSPEAAAVGRRDLQSGALRAAAVRMAGGPGGARRATDFLNANRESVTAQDQHALDELLRPLVNEQTAQEWVDSLLTPNRSYAATASTDDRAFGARSGAAIALATDRYAQRLRQIESGGRLDARTDIPGQTAAGPFGFVNATWLQHIRGVQARGGLPDTIGMTEDELLGLRTTSEEANAAVFASFRAQNREVLRRLNLPINDVTEHIMHWWGGGDGAVILNADPTTLVSDIAGAEAAANNGMTGKTVGQLLDTSAARMGAPGGPTAVGLDDVDIAAAFDRVLELPPEAREIAISRLSRLLQAQGVVRQDAQEEAQKSAYEGFLRGTVDPNNVPIEQRLAMGQAGFSAFQSAVQNQLTGVQFTDEVTRTGLLDMAAENPSQFAGVNLEYLRGSRLSDSDYRHLSDLQRDMRAQLREQGPTTQRMQDNVDSFAAFMKVAPIFENIVGFDPRDPSRGEQTEQVTEFRRTLQRLMQDFVAANGVQPGEAALQTMTYEALTTANILQLDGRRGLEPATSLLGGQQTAPLFDLNRVLEPGQFAALPRTSHSDIPADIRNGLDQLVTSIYGDAVSPNERVERVELLNHIAEFTNGSVLTEGLLPSIETTEILEDPLVGGFIQSDLPNILADGAAARERFRITGEDGRVVAEVDEVGLRRWYAEWLRRSLRDAGAAQ